MVCLLMLPGCVTQPLAPARLILDPEAFDNQLVRIEYRIGYGHTEGWICSLKITNKTDAEMFIDFNRCSLVSFDGETRFIQPKRDDDHIPPHSYLIVESDNPVFFSTNIDAPFETSPRPTDPFASGPPRRPSEKEILQMAIGHKVRLFLPVTVNAAETIYDLVLSITGVEQKNKYTDKQD